MSKYTHSLITLICIQYCISLLFNIFRKQNPDIGYILKNIINSFVKCTIMNIINICYVCLFSEDNMTHIDNGDIIYYTIIEQCFNKMCVNLQNISKNLYFDIYLIP